MTDDRFAVTYRVRSDAASITTRADAIAVEQSVEMPLAAIDDPAILADIVGKVEDITDQGHGVFLVRVELACATIGRDAGQFLNMIFGNTSLHEDVMVVGVDVPPSLSLEGPCVGIAGLRARLGAACRAFTGSALKPQGLSAAQLAALAESLALGGLDFIKDDHGLADQDYSPYRDRMLACAEAVARASGRTGHPTRYVPSITGDLDRMRAQLALAQTAGVDCAMVAPMVAGFSTVQTLRREFPDMAMFAHPSLGGAARIAPEVLIGCLFRALGADAVIFPNHGGRFGYSPDACRRLAGNAREPETGTKAALPVPAGGMTLTRTGEMLDFYGPDTMLLIGGNLLMARERITAEAASFAEAVARHTYAGGTRHGQ